MTLPRAEYPRPQLVREEWANLNGIWKFQFDHSRSGRERKLYRNSIFPEKILVPFPPESLLSGLEHRDFMPAVWYRREFNVPDEWLEGRLLIHFGAVDYYTEVWINGRSAGCHRGGYTPFSLDITELVEPGRNTVTVCAEDDIRSGRQPGGKQSSRSRSYQCYYTRTTGIWQTVWLEPLPETYLHSLHYHPDPANQALTIAASLAGDFLSSNTGNSHRSKNTRPAESSGSAGRQGWWLKAEAFYRGRKVGQRELRIAAGTVTFSLELEEKHLWEPGSPRLYDLVLTLAQNSREVDWVESYFGLRSIALGRDKKVLLNGKPLFQRLVLDQGYYPEGIYTAPADDALKRDIELSLAMGFNGARLHQKVFDPRYLYWADRLGYLVWGEYGSWGLDISTPLGLEIFLPEWLEAVERDYNHPALIGWCPFNETWDFNNSRQDDEVLRTVYQITRRIDPGRPVIDTSGNYHVATDIFDIHDYEQDPEKFAAKFAPLKAGGAPYNTFPDRQSYGGQPYFVSEYGGIWWNPADKDGWGYGSRPASEEEFLVRYQGLTSALLKNPEICGFCYTQLYDVEQEKNGLYTYDRRPKFDPRIIREINSQPAAFED